MFLWNDYYLWQGNKPQKTLPESSANNKKVSNYPQLNAVINHDNNWDWIFTYTSSTDGSEWRRCAFIGQDPLSWIGGRGSKLSPPSQRLQRLTWCMIYLHGRSQKWMDGTQLVLDFTWICQIKSSIVLGFKSSYSCNIPELGIISLLRRGEINGCVPIWMVLYCLTV